MPHMEDRATYRDALRVFRREVHALFQHPEAAREEILYSLTFWGCEYTCATLRASPYKFSPVRMEAEFEQHARTADAACRYDSHRTTRVRRVLVAAAQALRDVDEALAWESIVSVCGEASRAAQSGLARAVAQRCAVRSVVRAFRKTARKVFECPRTAVRRIYDYCVTCGVDATVRALYEMPQVFGSLRGRQADFGLGWVSSHELTFTTYVPARTSARTLGVMLRAIVRALSDTRGMRQVQEMAAAAIVAASALREASAAAERRSLRPSAQLLLDAAFILERFADHSGATA